MPRITLKCSNILPRIDGGEERAHQVVFIWWLQRFFTFERIGIEIDSAIVGYLTVRE